MAKAIAASAALAVIAFPLFGWRNNHPLRDGCKENR